MRQEIRSDSDRPDRTPPRSGARVTASSCTGWGVDPGRVAEVRRRSGAPPLRGPRLRPRAAPDPHVALASAFGGRRAARHRARPQLQQQLLLAVTCIPVARSIGHTHLPARRRALTTRSRTRRTCATSASPSSSSSRHSTTPRPGSCADTPDVFDVEVLLVATFLVDFTCFENNQGDGGVFDLLGDQVGLQWGDTHEHAR